MAMITAVKLNYFASAGEGARESDRAHGRFCACTYQTELVNGWDSGRNSFGELDLQYRGRAKGKALQHSPLNNLDDLRVSVTENQWPPRADEVDIALSTNVKNIAAFTARDKKRHTADQFPCSYGTVYTAWNSTLCAAKNF